jgi:hypothetical protein
VSLRASLQRRCVCGGHADRTGTCAAYRARSRHMAPRVVHDVLRSPGRSLEPAVRSDMEGGFGTDFSQMRVHADSQAAESAGAFGAAAYTVGRHIVFGHEAYAPRSVAGRRLLAHELTHVRQQRGSGAPHTALAVDAAISAAEQEARATATLTIRRAPAHGTAAATRTRSARRRGTGPVGWAPAARTTGRASGPAGLRSSTTAGGTGHRFSRFTPRAASRFISTPR